MRERRRDDVAALRERGVTPGLAVVLVGDDPASAVYVGAKEKACERSWACTARRSACRPTRRRRSCSRSSTGSTPTTRVHGILVQMPLPKQIDADAVIRRIDPAKDVDGFHPVNVGKLLIGERDGFARARPPACMVLLREYGVQTAGAECVVVGRSNIVGKPMAALLMQPGARRHGDRLPQPHARPRRAHAPRRHPHRRGGRAGHDHRGHGQARRRRHRRRHQSRGRPVGAKGYAPRRRRRFRVACARSRRDHAGARRSRADDDRDAARRTRCARRSAGDAHVHAPREPIADSSAAFDFGRAR